MTHPNGAAVQFLPLLQTELFRIGDYVVFVYKILQHGSTAVGFVVIGIWIVARYRTSRSSHVDDRRRPPSALHASILIVLIFIPLVSGIVRAICSAGVPHKMSSFQSFTGLVVRTWGFTSLVCLLATGVVWQVVRRSTNPPER